MDLFVRSWSALRAAVASLEDEDFALPSGCVGWLVRDLVCHLIIDAQDVLITLATPSDSEPTHDAAGYWDATSTPPSGEDPLGALTVRLAAAYQDPQLLAFHLDDVGSAAGRAAELADPAQPVSTQGKVLTTADYLGAYLLEWTLHHLDLLAHLSPETTGRTIPGPPADALNYARELFERVAGKLFPLSWSDADTLLIGTGRRPPTAAEREEVGLLAAWLPFSLG